MLPVSRSRGDELRPANDLGRQHDIQGLNVRDIDTGADHGTTPLTESSLTELSFTELDDTDLLSLARRGHDGAYGALFARHSYAAHRLARHLGAREEADDIVSESFAQVLDLVRRGKGPDRAFRAYLFTTIRHEAGRRAKARQRVMPTDDERHIDSVVPFGGGDMEDFEKSAIRDAYESLPARWRTVLWHLDVEGRKPQELGPLLELSPNGVSALAYRARSGLREAYLQQHVNDSQPISSRECRDVRSKLSAYVRETAPAREQAQVRAHIATCLECTAVHDDLQEVNREVGSVAVPAAAGVSLFGLIGAGVTGSWAWLSANLVAVGKAAFAVVTPSATVAAVTAATVMGVTGSDVVDPPRHPMTSQAEAPHANRARVASVAAQPPAHSKPAARKSSTRTTTPVAGTDAKPAEASSTPDKGSVASPPPTAAPQPQSQPKVSVDLGGAVSVQADGDGVKARIAGVTVEVPSRLVSSLLSQGTTND
jgi:RNA polymerase sigma factor (sigma-70 family)